MPTTYVTNKRGAELAREILDTIEVEDKLRRKRQAKFDDDDYDAQYLDLVEEVNAWNQGSWGDIFLDKLPKGVDVSVVPDKAKVKSNVYVHHGEELISISGGLSCGTAMCFAGHAVNMVGDRPVIAVNTQCVDDLRSGRRKSLRRWLGKLKKSNAHRLSTSEVVDQVLTPQGKIKAIRVRAQELLEIDESEADELFAGSNTLQDLRRLVKRMENGKHLVTGKAK